jgi:glycosyl transferase family 25
MRVLIINVAHATERMAFMQAQMQALGLQWERVEGVTPLTLSPPAEDPVWHRWQRPLRTTEMALCASHAAAWRRIVELGQPCLVLEDDAVLASETPGFLTGAEAVAGVDHISLETRARKKLVARRPHGTLPMRGLYQDRTGSAAAIIYPSGARKLLAHVARAGGPSDAVISSTYSLVSHQADPALAVQLDLCPHYGLPQPLATASLIDAERKPLPALPAGQAAAFRMRRISAQLRMGWRQLVHAPVATRRHIAPSATIGSALPTRD